MDSSPMCRLTEPVADKQWRHGRRVVVGVDPAGRPVAISYHKRAPVGQAAPDPSAR